MGRTMRGLAALGLAAAGSLLSSGVAPPSAAGPDPWPQWRAPQGGIMRHAVTVDGEWVYTNTLWLALGANTDGLEREDYYAETAPDDPGQMSGDLRRALTYNFFGAGRSVTNGDHELPTDREQWPDGTGEIAELRMQATDDELFLRIGWHAFPRPDAQIATITFSAAVDGTHRNWPDQARIAASWDMALTVSGLGAVLRAGDAAPVPVASRVADHAFEVRVPRAQLPAPSRLVVRGGGGLANPDDPTVYRDVGTGPATATRAGSGGPISITNVWSLLFADDEPWGFDELTQSRLLRSTNASVAHTTVDLDALASGASAAPLITGDLSRIYRSRHDGGDGIERSAGVGETPALPPGTPVGGDFNVSYTRTGRLQDYAMRVPAAYTPARQWPLIVYLHGFGGTPEEAFRLPLGLVDEAEERGYLFASLQGRGDLFYRPGLGELDVVEALADIAAEYAVDPDRIYLMGHSMGGYGTNNIAARYPDLFAAVAPVQGTDAVDLAQNLRHVPWLMITSDEDLDARAVAAEGHYSKLSELGYHATLLRYRLKIHEYSTIYDTLPRLFEHFGAQRRVVDPSVVTWVAPEDDVPELGLVHDGAYWLSGVPKGSVTVRSYAIPPRPGDDGEAVREVVDPIDEGGPSGRTVAILRTTRPAPAPDRALSNRLDLAVDGATLADVDLARARLVADGLDVCPGMGDGIVLGLLGAAGGTYEQLVDGGVVRRLTAARGRLTVPVAAGGCTTLRLLGRSTGGGEPLPATGRSTSLWLAALAALSASTALIRRSVGPD